MDRAPFQLIDIHKGIDSTLVMLSGKLMGLQVVKEYDQSLPDVPAYPGELNQVWTNLIDNAAAAMAGEGTLTVRTRLDDDCVSVEIADTGPGISADVLGRVYEPFFTTKPVGEGTGLGLDISWRIVVNRHRGDIRVASQPGETVFTVRLPLTPPSTIERANLRLLAHVDAFVRPGMSLRSSRREVVGEGASFGILPAMAARSIHGSIRRAGQDVTQVSTTPSVIARNTGCATDGSCNNRAGTRRLGADEPPRGTVRTRLAAGWRRRAKARNSPPPLSIIAAAAHTIATGRPSAASWERRSKAAAAESSQMTRYSCPYRRPSVRCSWSRSSGSSSTTSNAGSVIAAHPYSPDRGSPEGPRSPGRGVRRIIAITTAAPP